MLLLRTAARGLDAQAADLRQNLLTADRLKARLAAKQDELVTAKSMLQSKQDELNDLIAARRALAATHQAEQAELLRDTAKLTATAADLRGLLDNMTRKKKQTGRPAILQARPDITLPVAGPGDARLWRPRPFRRQQPGRDDRGQARRVGRRRRRAEKWFLPVRSRVTATF
ncbi:MAG: hypothetical protein WDO70_07120 [Alphaproteobacteria bacterium]